MAMINNCNPVGPFNTPLDENGNLVFTQAVHGFDLVLEWEEYFDSGEVGRSITFGNNIEYWPIINGNGTSNWFHSQNEDPRFCTNLGETGDTGWTLMKFQPTDRVPNINQMNSTENFTLQESNNQIIPSYYEALTSAPYQDIPKSESKPFRSIETTPILRNTTQYYDTGIFHIDNLNTSYQNTWEDASQFFVDVISINDTYNIQGELYYWVKVGCSKQAVQEFDYRQTTGSTIVRTVECICEPNHSEFGHQNNPLSFSDVCLWPQAFNYQGVPTYTHINQFNLNRWWESIGDRRPACITREEGGMTRTEFLSHLNVNTNYEYEAVGNQSAPYTFREVLYMDDIHPAFDYKPGCPNEEHPAYNPDVCFFSDDENYEQQLEVCPVSDCNGTPIDELESPSEGSILDECGQCICGSYVFNNPSEQNNCIFNSQAEDCYMDEDGTFCVESEHDDCNMCNYSNTSDQGCGCFAPRPEWFFLDNDGDCRLNEFGDVVNAGGPDDQSCDVSLFSGKLFCTSFGNVFTENTCNFGDNIPGEPSCGWLPHQPNRYVNCNTSVPIPLNTDMTLGWFTDVFDNNSTIQGNCDFGGTDESSVVGELIEGCRDENASNYNSEANSGFDMLLCEYNESIGSITFNFDYNTYNFTFDLQLEVQVLIDGIDEEVPLSLNESSNTYKGTSDVLEIGKTYNYRYFIKDGDENQIEEGITREILVESGKPTFVNINYFNEYRNQFDINKTTLPIFRFVNVTDIVQNPRFEIFRGEVDEPIDTSVFSSAPEFNDIINSFGVYTSAEIFGVEKNDFSFESDLTDSELEILNIEKNENNNWYIDTLKNDKTKIRNALGNDILKNLKDEIVNDSYLMYVPDKKFIETFFDYIIPDDDNDYRGINLITEKTSIENYPEGTEFYNFNIVTGIGEQASGYYNNGESIKDYFGLDFAYSNVEQDIIDWDAAFNWDSVYDWLILTELIGGNIITNINDSKVTINNNKINFILPDYFDKGFGSVFTPTTQSGNNSFYWNSISDNKLTIDTSDNMHDGSTISTIRAMYADLEAFGGDNIDLFIAILRLIYTYKSEVGFGETDHTIVSAFGKLSPRLEGFISRYNTLRGSVLDIDRILERIDYYYDYLKNSVKSDNKRWRYLDYDNYETYEEVINNLKQYIEYRIKFIDVNIKLFGGNRQIDPATLSDVNVSFCNDPSAINWNPISNFNDNSCQYYTPKSITFEVDTTNVNVPKIQRMELEILSKIYEDEVVDISERFDMTNVRNNIWEFTLDVTMKEDTLINPGDKIEYHFIKYIDDVYNVETGAIEQDNSRFHVVNYERRQTLSHYFNDFIDTLERTNLPIIKLDTINYNDFGPVTEDNPNLFYCPTYLLPNGYYADGPTDEICDMMKAYHDNPDLLGSSGAGYYITQEECEVDTQCTVPCIDGTNPQDEPKVAGFIDLIYNGENAIHTVDDKPQLSTKVGVEVRGFSSRGFPKKQYAVELQEMIPFPQCNDENAKYNLFCNGFSPEEGERYDEDCIFTRNDDFVLLGPYRDRVYVRNALTYELFDEMGHPSSNSKHVEFYLNGIYQGIYVVFEKPKISSTRMDVGETYGDEGEIKCDTFDPSTGCDFPRKQHEYEGLQYCCAGGYVVKIESGGEQDFFILDDGFSKVEYYDPKASKLSDVEKDFIKKQVQNSIFDSVNNYDTASFSDYAILQELAKNNEGYTRSQYWYVKDDNPDKFYIGYIWDMNHAFGAVRDTTGGYSHQEFFAVGAPWWGSGAAVYNIAGQTGFLTKDENNAALYERWVGYRSQGGLLDIDNLLDRIDSISSKFKEFDAIFRDESRWFYSNVQDYDEEFYFFKTWILSRISYMDAYISSDGFEDGESSFELNEDYNKTFIRISKPENNKIYDLQDTKFIEFNWISSQDLVLYSTNAPVGVGGDNYITFDIINDITGDLVHSFSSQDLYGSDKQSFPNYTWNISDLDNIQGSYYIVGRYVWYEAADEFGDVITPNTVLSNRIYFSIQSQSEFQGCTDTFAINFDISAQVDDGSCKYQEDCDEKYVIQRTDVEGLRTFLVQTGYNILSYPYPFAAEDLNFFDVLNSSYFPNDGQTFSEYDGLTAHFEGNSYSAVFINGEWKSTNTKGFNINNIKPGMGIILELQKPGFITWNIPQSERSE